MGKSLVFCFFDSQCSAKMVKIFLASQVLKSPDSVAPPGFCNRGE